MLCVELERKTEKKKDNNVPLSLSLSVFVGVLTSTESNRKSGRFPISFFLLAVLYHDNLFAESSYQRLRQPTCAACFDNHEATPRLSGRVSGGTRRVRVCVCVCFFPRSLHCACGGHDYGLSLIH